MVALSVVLFLAFAQSDQSRTGDLRIAVADASGAAVQSDIDLINEANQFHEHATTDARGAFTATRLPFGTYRVLVTRSGFAPSAGLVEIRTSLPTTYQVTLMVAAVDTTVTVSADRTLIDLHRTSTVNTIGEATVAERLSALPGRSVANLVDTQPGWLMEANGVLHPRGSEYQVQYVVDGLPITDNRSAAFAPGLDADDVHSLSILTGGYPAEYGRKLGGVVEVATAGQARLGFHGNLSASAGSFSTVGAYAMGQYSWPRTTFSMSADRARTNRYLDPPVEENVTNSGTTSNASVHFEHQLSDTDRVGVIVRSSRNAFSVPNELVQQEAGQRQDRRGGETLAQFSYQHIFSASMLAEVRGMTRDASATLTSNALATPIQAGGDRGIRETYIKAALTINAGRHEWKLGGDASVGRVREAFEYRLTDPDQFDAGTPATFVFAATSPDREQALFIQDQARLGSWTVNAGLRWDHYRLVVDEQALSPRVAVAWAWPAADLTIRASYDRVFQTPAVENLLLASSPAVDQLNASVVRLPVRPSRGNFSEVGASKRLAGHLRLDVTHFWRRMDDFADDDVLLNTGVSFPIAFQQATVTGTEVKLESSPWHGWSGFLSYANMTGVGSLPITGGLLLGDEAAQQLTSTEEFPISQDQHHSLRGRIACQIAPRAWVAMAASYGSGLPVEFAGDPDQALAQYGSRIVGQVDFGKGRVRSNFSLDASTGLEVAKTKTASLRLQIDVVNLLNRLNVINFAGLFSGTALASPRSVAFRLSAAF
jgi:outer membrane cobalamin receptor